MAKRIMHIGLDDTDSIVKGCTTYVAALLVEKLEKLGAKFIDYPSLIRLNPNVPWKTRGNGALCLRIEYAEDTEEKIKETIISTVEEHADLELRGTDPGIVFFRKAKIPREVKAFSKKAIEDVVRLEDALKLLAKFKSEAVGYNKCIGIIGSLAAVGETLSRDHTFEILAYRTPEKCGSKRMIDEDSIFKMDRATEPYTFNNVDLEKRRVVITPRGPDPILLGIRGETAEIVKKAFGMVRLLEPVERWVIFRTNQGTDAHLKPIRSLAQLRPYVSAMAKGTVSASPKIIPRKHVIFSVKDDNVEVDCAAYEPTGTLRKSAMKLMIGDFLEVYGGVRSPSKGEHITLNLEKLELLKLAQRVVYRNPICPNCGKRVKSMGKGQGFRCEKCGQRHSDLFRVECKVKREIVKGLYITSTRSQRHLTKPFRRYGMEKRGEPSVEMIDEWHSSSS